MGSFPVHKEMTFKSGKFTFSAKFSDEKLTSNLIESEILFKTINDLPILPSISAQMQEEIVKRSIFSTAALEGNPLPEKAVIEILNQDNYNENSERAKKEIQNLKEAYKYLRAIYPPDNYHKIGEELIRNIHKSITSGINYNDNSPGKFRNFMVKVGDANHGGIYTPPKILKDISNLIKIFIEWINCDEMMKINPIIRAALSHYHLGLIHPFGDGNGRTARLVEAIILQTSGFRYVPVMLSNFYYRNIDDYYWAFSKSIRNKEDDVTDFLEFVLRGMIESLNEIKETITFHIRVLTLKDYFLFLYSEKKITNRQYDLLLILIENIHYQFTLNEIHKSHPLNILYRNVSPSTIRRDIKKLLGLGLLKAVNEQGFQINLNALE
ncbi:Fic family protein [candidate division KSB1 bacterium]|nr:Fic family protein [candidate division KSB1 bacterium]